MIVRRISISEEGVRITDTPFNSRFSRNGWPPSHNEVMRQSGGYRTAVLDSLGIMPGDVDFENKKQRFIDNCKNAQLPVVEQAGVIISPVIE